MKIEDIKVGKKFYHTFTIGSVDPMTGKKRRATNTYFVVEVDHVKNRVCASCNGNPAQWVQSKDYSRWKLQVVDISKASPRKTII